MTLFILSKNLYYVNQKKRFHRKKDTFFYNIENKQTKTIKLWYNCDKKTK